MNRDRYERAKRVLGERSRETQRRAAELAISQAAQARTEAEKQAEQLKIQAQRLHQHADTVLDRLAENGFPDMITIRVSKKGSFGRTTETLEPGWPLADVQYTYKIQGDDQMGFRQYHLLADGTFTQADFRFASGSQPLSVENIVQDDATHIALLRGLRKLGGDPEIF